MAIARLMITVLTLIAGAAFVVSCAGFEKRPGVLEAAGILPAPPSEVSIMSFNIRYGTALDGENDWKLRRGLVADVIASHSPDVIGLQEALRFQIDDLRGALPEYSETGLARDDGAEKGEYSAILYRHDRLSAIDGGTFWLSDTPDVPGSKTWGNNFPRICTWVRLRERAEKASSGQGGRTLCVFNVHLDHESEPSRRMSIELLAWRIQSTVRPDDTVIVTGDFNCGEESDGIRFMRGEVGSIALDNTLEHRSSGWSGMTETYRERHANAAAETIGTFHAFRGTTSGEKIDYIFVRPAARGRNGRSGEVEILSADIDRTSDGERWPSDHFPVVAVIRIKD